MLHETENPNKFNIYFPESHCYHPRKIDQVTSKRMTTDMDIVKEHYDLVKDDDKPAFLKSVQALCSMSE